MPPKRRRTRRARRVSSIAARFAASGPGLVAAGRKRRRYAKRRQRRRVQGGNFFKKLWSGVKKGFSYIKDNKLASKVLSLIPHPTAQKAAAVARVAGVGPQGGVVRMRTGQMRIGNHVMMY